MRHRTLQEQIDLLEKKRRETDDQELRQLYLTLIKKYYDAQFEDITNNTVTTAKTTTEDRAPTKTFDVFISHSSQDTRIAEALIELLRGALNIDPSRIRCTSVKGYKLPGGADVNEQLRLEVHDTRVLVAIVTEASLASTYGLFELGARWGAKEHLMPLLAGGADGTVLKDPLKSLNALRCDDAADVNQFLDDMAKSLGLSLANAAAYQGKIKSLVNRSKAKKKIGLSKKTKAK